MPTNILTTGTTYADSSDVTVDALEELTVAIKSAGAGASVSVQLKDDNGAYHPVDELSTSRRALVISAGVWRFTRTGGSCGVFSG